MVQEYSSRDVPDGGKRLRSSRAILRREAARFTAFAQLTC
jgi:hypothetical protein